HDFLSPWEAILSSFKWSENHRAGRPDPRQGLCDLKVRGNRGPPLCVDAGRFLRAGRGIGRSAMFPSFLPPARWITRAAGAMTVKEQDIWRITEAQAALNGAQS
ncbi:hypothetical protein, partial [Burkholderia glumae]|uniref:hypothetical protein n=1 Tax=Burkholderia glumae TaxID=337 RepID=UPI0019D70A38